MFSHWDDLFLGYEWSCWSYNKPFLWEPPVLLLHSEKKLNQDKKEIKQTYHGEKEKKRNCWISFFFQHWDQDIHDATNEHCSNSFTCAQESSSGCLSVSSNEREDLLKRTAYKLLSKLLPLKYYYHSIKYFLLCLWCLSDLGSSSSCYQRHCEDSQISAGKRHWFVYMKYLFSFWCCEKHYKCVLIYT